MSVTDPKRITPPASASPEASPPALIVRPPRLIWARLLIGLAILISAEVFSGASLKIGLWHPWTLIVTFWLYFAHFFFFTTLAVWTGRTTFWSLYLWGVLFGLYESWITKVIWHGYEGDGKLVLGSLGPFGFSEFSMVVIFHPFMSFIFPLTLAGVWFPSLNRWFPDLGWFTSGRTWARVVRVWLMVNVSAIVAMNSGGPLNLALNLTFAGAAIVILRRLASASFAMPDAARVVVFGKKGFAGLCTYLLLLYGVTYFKLRPEGLPSISVQLLTVAIYLLAIGGLWVRPRWRGAAPTVLASIQPERRPILHVVAVVLGLGFLLSLWRGSPALFIPVIAGFVVWTPVGLVLFVIALVSGWTVRRRGISVCR